jgi:hypothetical protein
MRRMRRGEADREPAAVRVIPRHEWPGRIVVALGCFTSSWCIVGMILHQLG